MSNSDGGLDGDGVAEEKHVGTPFVQPVICPPKKMTIAVSQDVDKQAI